MKKAILIIGGQGSGKSSKIKEIASQFQSDEVVGLWFYGIKSLDDPFLFSECTEKTKLVFFEELYKIDQVEAMINIVSNPILVNKPMKQAFTIEPTIAITFQSNMQGNELAEFKERMSNYFDVIECKYKGRM